MYSCNEIAYTSNDRNSDTISIECCHPDATGKFNQETKDTLIHLTAWLMGRYGLTTDDVIRHYDVTGKNARSIMWNMKTSGKNSKEEGDAYIERMAFCHRNQKEFAIEVASLIKIK